LAEAALHALLRCDPGGRAILVAEGLYKLAYAPLRQQRSRFTDMEERIMATLALAQPQPQPADPPASLRAHRFTVAQYHRLLETGILREHDRVELIQGLIVDKMTHNPPHDGTVLLVQTEVLQLLPGEWVLRIQSAITLTDSEPEPDLTIARGPRRRYLTAHPRTIDIGQLIEVSDTSLEEDRSIMGPLYAQARIPCYWIVNLKAGQVEVYREPRAGKSPGYRQRQDFGVNASVPLILGGREVGSIPVREILP